MASRTLLTTVLLVACLSGCTPSEDAPTPLSSPTALADSTPAPSPSGSASPVPSASPVDVPVAVSPSAPPSAEGSVPSSSRPDFSDLVVRPDGLGTIVIGGGAAESGMLLHDPDHCTVDGDPTVYGYAPGDPAVGRWLADYPEQSDPSGLFEVAVDDEDRVTAIGIRSLDLATAEGIRVGSTREELLAAYPTLEQTDVGSFSTVYAMSGTGGRLVFEVLDSDYDPQAAVGSVVLLAVGAADAPAPTARYATDASIGGCL
jgi:hypothetical protein